MASPRDRHGFTVVELMVTITLVALVLGVVLDILIVGMQSPSGSPQPRLRRPRPSSRSRASCRTTCSLVLGDAERHRVWRHRRRAGDDGEVLADGRPRRRGRGVFARPRGVDPFDVRDRGDLRDNVDGRVHRRHAVRRNLPVAGNVRIRAHPRGHRDERRRRSPVLARRHPPIGEIAIRRTRPTVDVPASCSTRRAASAAPFAAPRASSPRRTRRGMRHGLVSR